MQYREFGNTGLKISALGFGAMRLPSKSEGDNWVVDRELAIAMIHRASELGVNYIDSAWGYHGGESEVVVGEALKGQRDKWILSTKLPLWDVKTEASVRETLETQLKRLQTDRIDFYHLHGLSSKEQVDNLNSIKAFETLAKAKEEGLIKHLSFSCHGSPEFFMEQVDTGIFSSILAQYNLLDRNYEKAFLHTHKAGVGTVAMGPVAGGRLAFPSEEMDSKFEGKFQGTYELALRFVLSNSSIDCALSGMSTMEQLESNAKIASMPDTLSVVEKEKIEIMSNESKAFNDLYCTGCNYCSGCPAGIKIAEVFKLVNYHKVFHLTEMAKREFKNIGTNDWNGKPVSDCTECGACEEICPQHLKVIEELKIAERELG